MVEKEGIKPRPYTVRMMANMTMMLSLMIVLSMVEHMLPPLPMAPPGVRLGLANIVTMYTLFFLGWREALTLNALKAVFILMARGPMAGLLSFCGGLVSVLLIILLLFISRNKASYLILSVTGAIGHNFSQIITASIILNTNLMILYWPVLLFFGVVTGSVTGTLLRVVMPYMDGVFCGRK